MYLTYVFGQQDNPKTEPKRNTIMTTFLFFEGGVKSDNGTSEPIYSDKSNYDKQNPENKKTVTFNKKYKQGYRKQ